MANFLSRLWGVGWGLGVGGKDYILDLLAMRHLCLSLCPYCGPWQNFTDQGSSDCSCFNHLLCDTKQITVARFQKIGNLRPHRATMHQDSQLKGSGGGTSGRVMALCQSKPGQKLLMGSVFFRFRIAVNLFLLGVGLLLTMCHFICYCKIYQLLHYKIPRKMKNLSTKRSGKAHIKKRISSSTV